MAQEVNERQIALRSATGNYTTAKDYWDKRSVLLLPWSETAEIAVSSAQYALVDNSMVSGNLAVGTSSTESAGLMVAELSGSLVGTAATTSITDSVGNVINLVPIRNATTHDPVTSSGFDVYGLLQCSSGVSDGTAIGAAASENTQISFAYINGSGVTTLATVNETIEFGVKKLYTERNIPTLLQIGGAVDVDVIAGVGYEDKNRTFVVTTSFTGGEVITLSTGSGSGSGASTASGDSITLNASAAAFNTDGNIQVYRNGVKQHKGVHVIWDSTTTFHFVDILDAGDYFDIVQLATT
jgi:hypothetical protein